LALGCQSQLPEAGKPALKSETTTENKGLFMLHDPVAMSFVIPILSIVLGIGVAVLAITLSYLKRKHIFTLYHQERMAALDKGVDLPPLPESLLSEDNGPRNPRRLLLRGLVWLFLGVAVIISVYAFAGLRLALFGLIPAGIGLATLIYYAVAGKAEADLHDQERTAASQRR
jgi:hypothetical protein